MTVALSMANQGKVMTSAFFNGESTRRSIFMARRSVLILIAAWMLLWGHEAVASSQWCSSPPPNDYQSVAAWCTQEQAKTMSEPNPEYLVKACHATVNPYAQVGSNGTFSFTWAQWGGLHSMVKDWQCEGTPAPSPAKPSGPPPCGTCVGDPIHAGTGNVFVREEDFHLSKALHFQRFYNSNTATAGLRMGPRWTYTYARRIRYTPASGATAPLAVAVRDEGQEWTYQYNGGIWGGEADVSDQLNSIHDDNGAITGWTLRRVPDHATEVYGADGALIRVDDFSGSSTILSYEVLPTDPNTGRRLSIVTDQQGRTIRFQYDNLNRISSVTTADGLGYQYRYGATGYLASMSTPDGSTRAFLYNEAAHLAAPQNYPLLTGILDELSQRYATYDYDAAGRGISTRLGDGANRHDLTFNDDGTTTVIDPLGGVSNRSFWHVSGSVYANTLSAPCEDCGPIRSRTYDLLGDLVQTTDFNGVVTTYTYDINHLPTQMIEASGTSDQRDTQTTWNDFYQPVERRVYSGASYVLFTRTLWLYNSRGQPTAQCDVDWRKAPGYVCTSSTDAHAGVRKRLNTYCEVVDTVICPIVGLVLTTDGPRTDVQDVTSYNYYIDNDESNCTSVGGVCHRLGDLKSTTDSAGLVTTYISYDKAGRPTRVRNPNGTLTDYTYTPRGWLATKIVRADTSGIPSSADAVTTIVYDPTGTVHSVRDPDGVTTTYTYDAAHRLTDITDANGARIHYTLDAAGNRTNEQVLTSTGTVTRSLGRTFNPLGQLTALADGLNRTVFAAGFADSYDGNGNLVHSQDGLSVQQKQSYDGLNRLVSTIRDYQSTNSATANTQSVTSFDALDRVTGFSDPDGLNTTYDIDVFGNITGLHSPDTGTTTKTYDVAGNLISTVDANQVTTAFTYDALGRPTGTTYPDTTLNVAYHYDESDSVTGCTGGFSKGHLTRVVESNGGIVYCYDGHGNVIKKQQTVGSVTTTTSYAWTLGDRLKSITTANGTVVAYSRDANGRIITVTATPLGGATTTIASNVAYQPFGPIASYTLGNGQTVTRTYDANGQLTDIASAAFSLHLGRDAMGNVAALGDSVGASPASETYRYDSLYRLTGVNGSSGSSIEAYTYNKTGDRLSKAAPGLLTGAYSYQPGTHRLVAVGTTTRQVDARGNTTANVLPSGTFGYGYNQRNRLAVVQKDGVTVGSYVLNALGQRVQKTVGSTSTRFDYDEASQLLSEVVDGTARDYVWLDDLPIGIIDRSGSTLAIRFIHADDLGSPRVVTDNIGAVQWKWAYANNPFGERAPASTPGYILNLRFPGQYFDAESGLNYNIHRNYEAVSGRYIQSDPIGLDGDVSTYAYVGGNPLRYIDPTGLCPIDNEPTGEKKISGPKWCPMPFPPNKPLEPLPGASNPSVGCQAAFMEKMKACVQKCPGPTVAMCEEAWRIKLDNCAIEANGG